MTLTVAQILAAPRYVPNRSWRWDKLADELRAARLGLDYAGADGYVFPEGTDLAAVQTVVNAHDPVSLTPAEQLSTERNEAGDDLKTQYAAAVNRLDAIVSQMATVKTQANTLAGRSDAQALTGANVKALAQGVALQADAISDEATLLKRLARLLKDIAT